MAHMISEEFDTFDAFLNRVTQPGKWAAANCASREKDAGPWTGYASFTDAVRLAREGWREGRDKLAAGMDEAARLTQPRKHAALAYDVGGAYPDVARYCAGAPDCMVTFAPDTDASRPVVRIIANRGARADVKDFEIHNWGVALLSQIDAIEQAGKSVELTIVVRSRKPNEREEFITIEHRIIAKRAGEPLELDRLAFILAHPAFHRRLGFSFRELQTMHGAEKLFRQSYGQTYDVGPDEQEPGTLYVPHVKHDSPAWQSLAAALERMSEWLANA